MLGGLVQLGDWSHIELLLREAVVSVEICSSWFSDIEGTFAWGSSEILKFCVAVVT